MVDSQDWWRQIMVIMGPFYDQNGLAQWRYYRIGDGRGGAELNATICSLNAGLKCHLDKPGITLACPRKIWKKISWADLMKNACGKCCLGHQWV